MKKLFGYLLIIVCGAGLVYFGLLKYNEMKEDKKPKTTKKIVKKENTVPSKDDFMEEAIKIQTLAENTNGNETCKCYKVKDLDPNTTLSGSVLVYTVDDLFISSLWLSNGYYIINGYENVSSGLVEESSEKASEYCGEASANTVSDLCAKSY